jgi:hypothetical protein
MSNEIRHKRSNVSGSKPALSLLLGELAINTADGVLFTKKNAGSDVMVEFHGSETAHLFKHQTSVPNPGIGYVRFYPKSDNNFYLRTSAGVERRLLTSDDSFWTASGNNIYNANAGNVGIGKTNPTAKLDVDGNIRAASIDLVKPALNSVNVQLSTPSVEEMALIHGVMHNKLRFRPPVLQEQSSDGAEWVTSSRATENQLADLMIGQGQGSSIVIIPISSVGQQNHYRLTWDYFGTYMYLNAVYIYGIFYNNVSIKIEGLLRSTEEWTTITESTVTGAPRHIYIPHQTLALHPSNYYSKARITFSVFSSTTTNNVTLCQIEWLGAYPTGRRNVETYDRDKNVTFPNQIIGQSFKSLVPTGTAPFVIASTTVNTNLNADLLDGYHASSFALSSHTHAYLPLSGGTMSNTNLVTNLNADLLDGQHASAFAPASHNHSFAGLSDVALVSPSAGHTLVYNGSAWVNNSQIRSVPGAEYNTIYIRSAESGDDFGDSEMYMTAEEGIYFRTNIGKATAAEASFDRYGIRSSKLMGTGERYLAAGSDGLIKVATVQPTQYWQRDAGNYILSPIESYDEVHAWLFKAGGVLMSDGYLETGRSGMYTVYNDMVVSDFYLSNNTFYYANSKLAFNNSTNLLTVDGGINAGSNLIAAGEVKLTKQTPGGVLRLQSHNAGPDFLRQHDYAGAVTFEAYNGSGYSGVATISARASQNHSGSGMGTNIEFWNYPNNGSNTRPAMILREDGILDNYFGFAVSGSDGKSGTATILTGCSYNSVTKTLIYTRASVTFSGGIVTNIASMSSLSVPLS